jgi:hypothetical protein
LKTRFSLSTTSSTPPRAHAPEIYLEVG